MKKKIGIAGNIILDVVKTCDYWPGRGMLTTIREEAYSVGGCVCNTAIDLKALDAQTEVSVYGRIGKDGYGKFVFEEMQKYGLDVSEIGISASKETSYTDVMVDMTTGERTFFQKKGANSEFFVSDVDIEKLDCSIFHLGYLLLLDKLDEADEEYGTKAARLLCEVQKRGIRTSIDLVSEQSERFDKVVVPALKYSDYVVINEIEAGRLAGLDAYDGEGKISVGNLKRICERILSYGVKECVTVHCPRLGCTLDATGEFTVVPSLALPPDYIVCSVGAGDAFCAGMLYSFLNGMSREDGLRLASCAAACNLAAGDSVGGAKNLSETMRLEKIYKRGVLSC